MSTLLHDDQGARRRALIALPAVLATAIVLLPAGPAVSATDPAPATSPTPSPTPAPATPTPTPAPNPKPPTVSTGTAEAIGGTSATLTATLSSGGAATSYRFEYGTTTSYGLVSSSAQAPASTSSATVKVPVTGLTPGTKYSFRIVATNAAGTVRGSARSFTTTSAPKAPAVSTQAASYVGSTRAQLNARVSPAGQPTTVRFEYGRTKSYGSTTPATSAGGGKGTVGRGITVRTLAPATTYHYRAVAQNGAGTTYGKDRTFRTTRGLSKLTAVAPGATIGWGATMRITGKLSGSKPGGVKLELLRQDAPYTGLYRRIATTTTSAKGDYRVTLSRAYNSVRLRVRVIGSTTLMSPELSVGSRLLVRLRASVRKARTTRLRGTIYPAGPGATAVLQRRTASGRWIKVRSLRLATRAGNRMSFKTVAKRLRRSSRYRVVVDPRDAGSHVVTVSGSVVVRARRR